MVLYIHLYQNLWFKLSSIDRAGSTLFIVVNKFVLIFTYNRSLKLVNNDTTIITKSLSVNKILSLLD